ncbi:acyl-CoA dehydrogenase family protein [Echinicola marina]|nr:acyl-CoA dehydrogenase family protein [Echinicola marina]
MGNYLIKTLTAKYRMTELQCEVADECAQLYGGYGYMWQCLVVRA